MTAPARRLRIALLAHEFLINIGANDFLKNLIRGLALEREAEITFLYPRPLEKLQLMAPERIKAPLRRMPRLMGLLRRAKAAAAPAAGMLVRDHPEDYDFYAEAAPRMRLLAHDVDEASLRRLRDAEGIDVFMPSIHILGTDIRHVNYWPDCQPKHFPEFFDDASQRVRDDRIRGLLATGMPLIINSRHAKADMVKFYDADPDQVFELPFAPIIEFAKLTPRPELARPFGLTRPYVIICNQFWIHKSHETVIAAAALAKRRGLDLDFVFTGRMQEPRRPEYIPGLHRLVQDLDVADCVKFLGYVAKDDQIELMKGAAAVVQPTLFEGGPGGGAIYDAMSLGVRAIVSDIPVNLELPLDPARLVTFRTRDAEDLVAKVEAMTRARDVRPSPEDLHQQARRSVEALSKRLYEAIDHALRQRQAVAA
jgi:glycosyltransferase involved in cell wall biosynthesis